MPQLTPDEDTPHQQRQRHIPIIWQPPQSTQQQTQQQPQVPSQQQQSSQPASSGAQSTTSQTPAQQTTQQAQPQQAQKQPQQQAKVQEADTPPTQQQDKSDQQTQPQSHASSQSHIPIPAQESKHQQTDQEQPQHKAHKEQSDTPSRQPTPTARRSGKYKWLRKDVTPAEPTQSESSAPHRLGQSLCQAAREYARNTAPDSTQHISGSDTPGSNAQANAESNAYETFREKSDKAIARSSHERKHYVYSSQYINTTMSVTYTTDRSGNITDVHITTSSGNAAIDNTVIRVIESADLPPIPPEHKEPYITRTITIHIQKAPGRDPFVLHLVRR